MCDFARASRRRYAAGEFTNSVELAGGIRILARRTHVFWLSLACLTVLPSEVQAQEQPDRQKAPSRFMLEVGLAGDTRQCPGHYVGINVRVAGPVSLYGMVENYRCSERTEDIDLGGGITGTVIYPRRVASDIRFGAEILLGRASWLVRPALRAGILYGGGAGVAPTAGASLTFGRRRYGARLILHVEECGSTACERFQMGGYVSF